MLTLAVSACLLGLPTRYDGTGKPEQSIKDLQQEHRLLAFCPECGCMLGVPRPKIHLELHNTAVRLIRESDGADLTEVMELFAVNEIRRLLLSGVTGFIVKSRSPSCGVTDTPLKGGETGGGLFVRKLLEIVPDIPITDETDWRNPEKREAFLQTAEKWIFRR
ncbi:MAG: DUF523 domain-containing protein [Lentisphaeria bacterium]|nr:DUF523 domain-containing protein [Lentisphaeria bacterium]